MDDHDDALAPSPLSGLTSGGQRGGWAIAATDLRGDDELVVRFVSAEGDRINLTVLPREVRGPVFRRFARHAVRYDGELAGPTAERRAGVAALIEGFCAGVDALLAARPGGSLAEALGRDPSPGTLEFSPENLRSMLGPALGRGDETVDGWRLARVLPYSLNYGPRNGPQQSLVLDFRRGERERFLLRVGPRDAGEQQGFATTAHLSLSVLTFGDYQPRDVVTLRALVALTLQAADHPRLRVVFPSQVTPLLGERADAGPEKPPEIVHLVLESDCGQNCSFCSLREVRPPEDGGARALHEHVARLRECRERGSRALKLTGYDPLTFSRLFELLEEARILGYESVEILSPSTRLGEPGFVERLLDAMPATRRFYVPVYGVTAGVHDRIVGRLGAFTAVVAALDTLRARLRPSEVVVTTVVTADTVRELVALAAFARARGLPFVATLPYPNYEPQTERFAACLPRQRDVAAAWADARRPGERWVVDGLAPCIAFREMQTRGVPVAEWLEPGDAPPLLPGSNDDSTAVGGLPGDVSVKVFSGRVPCPHAARCALRLACPGEVLRAYAEQYGLDELSPVSLRDLLGSFRPPAPRSTRAR